MSRLEMLSGVMSRFLLGVDEQNADRMRAALAEDAENAMFLDGEKIGLPPGREGIVGYIADFWKTQTDQRRHVLSNAILESESPDAAVVSFYMTLYATKDRKVRTVATGKYRVQFAVKGDRGWIRRVELTLDGPFD
jgi:SnoaL-like protein